VHGARALWIDGSLGTKGMLRNGDELATTISDTISQLMTPQAGAFAPAASPHRDPHAGAATVATCRRRSRLRRMA
jgi:hypothetical protein